MKRLCLALAVSVLLTACGGGSTPSAPSAPKAANIRNVPVQRAVSSQALLTMQIYGLADSFGSSLLQSIARRGEVKAIESRWIAGHKTFANGAHRHANVTYGPCTNGIETATVTVSPTEVQVYERTFFDAACTTLYQDIFVDIAATGTASAVGAGNATQYDQNANVISYDSFSVNVTGTSSGSQVAVQITNSPDAESPPDAAVGLSCLLTGASAPQSCGMGATQDAVPLSKEAGVTMLFTETTTGSAATIAGNGRPYTGGLDALVLGQGTFPAWTITGGTAGNPYTFNASISDLGVSVLTGSATIVDAADAATVTLTFNAQGASGVVTQTGSNTALASFDVNLDGNGTITYSDGSTAAIVDWIVQG